MGKNGPLVPRIGMGLMGVSAIYGLPAPTPDRLALLDRAYELGDTFWDTADMYGDSEDLLGTWFAANPDKRKDIFLATKFAERGIVDGKPRIDSTPDYCREAIEKSLKRLGLPYVDLYYIHRFDRVTPVEKTMAVMIELKNAGKIRYIGLSECSSTTLRRAHAMHPVTAVQIEYSPITLDIERNNLLETARELGVAIVTYSPLGRGLLTGHLRKQEDWSKEGDFRRVMPWLNEENFPNNLKMVDELAEIAKAKGATLTQLVLSWVLAQGDDIFTIPGTTKVGRLEENLGCLKITLSPDEEKQIRTITSKIQGPRFGKHGMEIAFADTPPLESS
ncbi:putative aldo-keto reductase putative protein [Phaeoacremonium minimum UCRPA7]|uniref:NADP-dependent oxidoreductase domain-containing protein n=1 Tax=Phaeoacremonium minimum (strain UCR-PA7) TaxID=1286976 RepID=R8BPI3_PHAM7|nr:putative aldo-keto reductase putative protein [Phaeoacremonium minimum UCRPA7]EOO01251.1 putative aldo-keto reductase putative protein [Phaeoacremonium minimum UCRPA7]